VVAEIISAAFVPAGKVEGKPQGVSPQDKGVADAQKEEKRN